MENKITDEPEFSWWVPYTLNKKNIVLSKVKTNYWRTTHKYVVRLPNNVTESMQIDQANGNTYWKYVLDKDMKKADIVYKPREEFTPEKVQK